jgi:hypothetical protein
MLREQLVELDIQLGIPVTAFSETGNYEAD